MDALKVRQAKTILDQTINDYFSREPDKDSWLAMRMYYGKICDLLEVADRLLHEGLITEPD